MLSKIVFALLCSSFAVGTQLLEHPLFNLISDPCSSIKCNNDAEMCSRQKAGCIPKDPCYNVKCTVGQHCENGSCVKDPVSNVISDPCSSIKCNSNTEICSSQKAACIPKDPCYNVKCAVG